MAGYIEDRWLKKRPDKQTGKRERTSLYGKGKRYRVKEIPGVQDRSFDTSADAKQWLATAKTDTKRGEFVDPRDGDICLTDYIADHRWPSRTDEPSTEGPMRSRIWNHVIPLLGELPLREIDASALRSFAAALLSRVEGSTAEVTWGHLSSILNSAVDDKRLPRNPHQGAPQCQASAAYGEEGQGLDPVRRRRGPPRLQDRYRFAIGFGLVLGLRQGEAFGLGEEDFDFEAGFVHVRRQLRWDTKGRPYFCLPEGGKTRAAPLSPNLAARARRHFRRFPSTACTLPWRNPEPPANALEARQRKPITVRLVLTTSPGNRVYYRTWNDRSWKPALAAAGVITAVGEKVRRDGGRIRRVPVYAAQREDMFHVLMPGAGKRGLDAMDAWLTQDQQPILPEKSLAAGWSKTIALNPQVTELIASGASMKVKYKETARGGLAVNIIEC
ncbi:integrase [Streptomyces coelicoflavus]|uniref:integrase n=1 Tax=Streptomyces coelicoflavus TaxID=285562 RepID=UPI0036B52B9C